MNGKLFEILLNALSPKTLAYLIRDLEASQADWRSYPQDAPPEAVQQELTQTLKTIEAVGTGLDLAARPSGATELDERS